MLSAFASAWRCEKALASEGRHAPAPPPGHGLRARPRSPACAEAHAARQRAPAWSAGGRGWGLARAGEHEQEQMQRIVELCGAAPRARLERAPRRAVFFGAAGAAAAAAVGAGGAAWQAGLPGGRGLAAALRCEDGAFLSFMQARAPRACQTPCLRPPVAALSRAGATA